MILRLRFRNTVLHFFPFLAEIKEAISLAKSYKKWRTSGLPIPAPHAIKRALLMQEGLRIEAKNFVETGTFTGDTVRFMQNRFKNIYSIEIQPELAMLSKDRFRSDSSVKIIEGDSATFLGEILEDLTGPTLFWLDGHYSAGITGRGSKDCPIYEELSCIAARPPSHFSIIIDDLRCFGTEETYPRLDELLTRISELFPNLKIDFELDMIWCRGK